MNEIEIRDDVIISYEDINDGECIRLSEEFEGEVTSILLIRSVALEFAKKIMELMGNHEE